ncbi:unnamed protein product [Darwinula stevensoni]|uniref:GDNF/GAS1 domain-containing protein n=1 Tax=Darwinula stevensoni TaxID=69355 RepID=A0A7R9A689_9CRUS|nr:unnamed protein product [Darwinula stevensoni]CAG0887051.1 unnamed protein product [Darwinula stevensoni]
MKEWDAIQSSVTVLGPREDCIQRNDLDVAFGSFAGGQPGIIPIIQFLFTEGRGGVSRELIPLFPSTCQEAWDECRLNDACHARVHPLDGACRARLCSPTICRAAIRDLYGKLPQEMSSSLAFCTCQAGDGPCIDALLRFYPSCSFLLPECSTSARRCMENPACSCQPPPPPPLRKWINRLLYQRRELPNAVLIEGFCEVSAGGDNRFLVPFGGTIRVYETKRRGCSDVCECDGEGEIRCRRLPCIRFWPCSSFSHGSLFKDSIRGRCLCYAGHLICEAPPLGPENLQMKHGVFLTIGFSSEEFQILQGFTGKDFPDITAGLQNLLQHHRGINQSVCELQLKAVEDENLVYIAEMDETQHRSVHSTIAAQVKRLQQSTFHPSISQ